MNTHKLKTLVVPVTSGVIVTIKGDSTPREAGQIVCRPFPGGGGWHMYLEGLGYYPLSKVILHSLPNAKEHTTPTDPKP